MDLTFQVVVAGSLVVGAVAAVVIATELRRLRIVAFKLVFDKIFDSSSNQMFAHKPGVTGSLAGYAIYVYRGGRWLIEADLSSPGFEPSPPTMPGSYEGQVLKKESTPSGDR